MNDTTMEFLHQYASEAGIRTQDQVKRRSAQTVTLQTQTVSAEPLAVRTHPQEDGLGTGSKSGTPQHRHSLSWRQCGSRLVMITASCARQLCIWCGSRHDSGPRLRSSWQPCECEFFFCYLVCKFCPPCPPRYVPKLGSLNRTGRVNLRQVIRMLFLSISVRFFIPQGANLTAFGRHRGKNV
jgi:hypothetical protein